MQTQLNLNIAYVSTFRMVSTIFAVLSDVDSVHQLSKKERPTTENDQSDGVFLLKQPVAPPVHGCMLKYCSQALDSESILHKYTTTLTPLVE